MAKNELVQLRVSADEKDRIRRFAEEMGMSVSELVLESVRAAYVHRPEMVEVARDRGVATAFYELAAFKLDNPIR